MTTSARWSDAFLDEARTRGDTLADAAVGALFDSGSIAAVNGLMRTLVSNDGMPSAELPKVILDYLAETSALPDLDDAKTEAGEQLFGLYGPECLMALGFYALPASYAAKKGVQVLYRTAYLMKRPMRRVFETTQMVIDVMAKGGLAPGGKGIRTAQKVRLMHAAVRHLLTHDPAHPWDDTLGAPLNQEDLAGTLMTFSFIVLEGLGRLGIDLSDDDKEAYLHAWVAIGALMGIEPALLPANMEEARELTYIIRKRQIAPSPEGRAMTAALVEGMQSLTPDFFDGLPASMIRFFLDQDTFLSEDVAGMLGVPPADWTKVLIRGIEEVGELVHWLGHSREAAHVIRFMSRRFVDALLLAERGGARAPFTIPWDLQMQWKLRASERPAPMVER